MSGRPRAMRSAFVPRGTGEASAKPTAATARVNRMVNCMMDTGMTAGRLGRNGERAGGGLSLRKRPYFIARRLIYYI